jgi:hypothetical protein
VATLHVFSVELEELSDSSNSESTETPVADFLALEFQHEKWCLTPTPRNFKLRYICEKGKSLILHIIVVNTQISFYRHTKYIIILLVWFI